MKSQHLLDQAVRDIGVPGIAVEVRAGDDLGFGTAGVANLDTGELREPQQQFRIGSATKTFTAAVVLQLVTEGVLDLDDTVEKWLPGAVPGRVITIRQLLDMTSGLFIYTMDEEMMRRFLTPAFLEHRFDRFTPEELVAISLRHPPTEGWTYTNTGYLLAARIVERATGSPYADQLASRVLQPLGLSRTYLPGDDTSLRESQTRHYSTLGSMSLHDVTDLSADMAWTAGGMVSTLSDLGTFVSALLGGEVLPPAELDQMYAVVLTPPHKWLPNGWYGLGAAAFDLPSGQKVWGSGGAINGSFCLSLGDRDGGRVVTMHVNTDYSDPVFEAFLRILDAELG